MHFNVLNLGTSTIVAVHEAQCFAQHANNATLAASSGSDNHQAMPHNDRFVQLPGLGQENGDWLQAFVLCAQRDGLEQIAIIDLGALCAREQIAHNTLEQGEVMSQELGQIDILQCSIQQCLLIHIRILPLEVSSSSNDSLHGPHAVIVMVLARKLLGAKLEGRYHLAGALQGLLESERKEHDFSDESVIGDHHGNWAEQSL